MKNLVGNIIREKRIERGLKQEYMALKLKITSHSYANIERGRTQITLARLISIAVLLNIKAHVIVQLAEEVLNI